MIVTGSWPRWADDVTTHGHCTIAITARTLPFMWQRAWVVSILVGCGPRISDSTERGVIVSRVNDDNLAKATDMARRECEEYGRAAVLNAWVDNKTVAFKCVDSGGGSSAGGSSAATGADTGRKTVHGDKPLFCAQTAEDVGLCFLDEAACKAEQQRACTAACAAKTAGSCFNTTKTLDGSRHTICALSISDCEKRRAEYEKNVDYTVTPCGIYRVEAHAESP